MHITAMQLQRSQKEEKVIARQEEIRGGGGRGVLAGVVWMNDEPGHGHGPELPN